MTFAGEKKPFFHCLGSSWGLSLHTLRAVKGFREAKNTSDIAGSIELRFWLNVFASSSRDAPLT